MKYAYTHRQFRSAHAQYTQPYRVVLLEFRVNIFYSIKRWLTLALWTTVLTGLTGWTTGKNCLVNMDAFTLTTNAAVTLLSGKYSYSDILWYRCTSYRNASGWVKSSLQSFVLFLGRFFLFLFHCLVYHENAFMFGQTSGNKLVSLKIYFLLQRWAFPWKSHSNDELVVW